MDEKIHILLIEDNPGDARLLKIYLEELFKDAFTLITSDRLAEGIQQLEKNHFDIIILDLGLPDSSGLDTFKKIYEHSPGTPIIVLTGLDDESIGINAVKLGAQDFLIKGKLKSKGLRRSINYSIERYKLINQLAEKTKRLEERTTDLNTEKIKLAQAQKISHIGNWDLDISTNVLNWSEELYHIYGLDPQVSITLEKVFEMTHPADNELVKSKLDEAITTHNPFHYSYRIIRADQATRTLDARGEVIVDDNNHATKIAGTLQDITELEQEKELEKLALAATQSYNSVIIANKNGRIEWVNEGFTKFTGYSLDDIKGKEGELFHQEAEHDPLKTNYYQSVVKEKKPVNFESKNHTKDGKEYWAITTLTPVIDNKGEVERIIAIESNITERKKIDEELLQANDELKKAKQQLEETMHVKERFFATMSHEIRTPMNAIVGFTDLMLKTQLTSEQRQYIDAVKTSGQNLIVIVNDILDFSKIQSGKISFEKTNFELSKTVSMVKELMLPKAVEKNIELSVNIDENVPDHIIGDPTRLNQILLNLLSNAIKFTEKGKVKVTVSLLSENNEEAELRFSVQDTGIGIPKQNLDSIFEEFTQAANIKSRGYGGSGLGLSIVKQLVELQGGKVAVESEVGVGSTFSFNITFRKDLSISKKKDDSSGEEDALPLVKGLNVLLVEDNELNKLLAKKVLTNWEWNVETAENGLIAVEKLKKQDFDIVLMDIQMPEMDGYEATRQIRNTFPAPKNTVPIMAMTAHAMAGEEEKSLEAGMDGYISKPFDQKVLYTRILSIINESKNQEEQNQLIENQVKK